jgi:CRP/FNR family transcriptional regulator
MIEGLELEFLARSMPFYAGLSDVQRENVVQFAYVKSYKAGQGITHGGECTGLFLVKHGVVRAFTVSDKGKEITLYRLREGDTCIFSASCILDNIDFEVNLFVEQDCELIIIPTAIFDELGKTNLEVSKFTVSLMSDRFSDVMWVLQQYVFNGTARRVADYLLTNSSDGIIETTHEQLANETGTAREVVTRLLKKMQTEDIISVERGKIKILNKRELSKI